MMSVLADIERAITELPEEQYFQLRNWFLEHDWKKWDRQIEEDSQSGKLDFLIKEALEEKATNKLTEL